MWINFHTHTHTHCKYDSCSYSSHPLHFLAELRGVEARHPDVRIRVRDGALPGVHIHPQRAIHDVERIQVRLYFVRLCFIGFNVYVFQYGALHCAEAAGRSGE
jgi:hypothetical protein